MNKPPNSKVNLDRAIQRIYGTAAKYVEIRSMIANTVVGQFLPEGVVKGGSALRLRYGLENSPRSLRLCASALTTTPSNSRV